MKFLQQLQQLTEVHQNAIEERLDEANVIRGLDQIRKYTARDIADFAFLHFLVLFILSNHLHEAPIVIGHARRTIQYGGFRRFTLACTDLYMYLHLLLGYNADRLKNDRGNPIFYARCHMKERDLRGMLTDMAQGRRDLAKERRFLLYLEKHLQIENSNYRSLRRLVSFWNDQETRNQRLVITRILLALRTRCPTSDMLVHLEHFAKAKRFEIPDVTNPELLEDFDFTEPKPQQLDELFNSNVDVKLKPDATGDISERFKVGDKEFTINFIKNDSDTWTVFYGALEKDGEYTTLSYSPTRTSGAKSVHVLSAVVNIIEKFLKKYKPDLIKFSGEKFEGLADLYTKMVNHLGFNLKKLGYTVKVSDKSDRNDFYIERISKLEHGNF